MTLLGPSGCGKTTTLRIVAGFEQPDSGRVSIGEEDVTALPVYRRSIGFVFQNDALFPHLTVFENVAYGLRVKRLGVAKIRQRVDAVLDLVGLPGHAARFPSQLSGGEQQRVAVARAVVVEHEVATPGVVRARTFLGEKVEYVVEVERATLEAMAWNPLRHGVFEVGSRVRVSCDPASLRPFADDESAVPGGIAEA